jgi:hypothetical protein
MSPVTPSFESLFELLFDYSVYYKLIRFYTHRFQY